MTALSFVKWVLFLLCIAYCPSRKLLTKLVRQYAFCLTKIINKRKSKDVHTFDEERHEPNHASEFYTNGVDESDGRTNSKN